MRREAHPVDVERFRGIVAARLGLQFETSRLSFLADVLRRRLDGRGENPEQYLRKLEGCLYDDEESAALAQELTIGETYFFRNGEQFRALSEVVLPGLLRQRTDSKSLRILSAGCASGEEAYTLAMVARDAVPDPSWRVLIRAVDLNPAALECAAAARYSPWALRETPPDVERRWFSPSGRMLALAPAIRSAVSFERRNLTLDDPELWRPGFYDVIFCRNVIMYFSPETMREVVARMAIALAPGGYLFLGHAETLRGLSDDFHLLHSHDTFYYRRRHAAQESSNEHSHVAPPPKRLAISEGGAGAGRPLGYRARLRTSARAARGIVAPPDAQVLTAWRSPRVLELLRDERFADALEFVGSQDDDSCDRDVMLLTAALLVHAGQFEAAEQAVRRLLALDEMISGAHYVLGLTHEAAGDEESAIGAYRLAAYLDPGFAMPRLHLGTLARRRRDLAVARRELTQALLLLSREDPARLILFCGGLTRNALIALCRSELAHLEARS